MGMHPQIAEGLSFLYTSIRFLLDIASSFTRNSSRAECIRCVVRSHLLEDAVREDKIEKSKRRNNHRDPR